MTGRPSILVALASVLAVAAAAAAMSGTDAIPKPVPAEEAKRLGWPDKSLPLMNDPLRVDGYHPWFSELPNAGYFFSYRVDSTDDANRLIALLGDVAAPTLVLELSPLASEGGRPVFVRQPDEDKRRAETGARLTMASQPVLDEWYKHLSPEQQEKFEAYKRPLAGPPTLTLFAGNPKLDLAKLVLPKTVTLASGVTLGDRQDPALAKAIERVERVVKDRGGAVPATRPAAGR